MLKERLKELRQETKKTQKEIAEAIGVHQSTLGYFETGERVPNIKTLQKLAKFYKVSTDYLLGISDIRAKAEVLDGRVSKLFKDPYVMDILKDIQDLSDEGKEEVMKYIEFIQSKNQKRGEDK